jgi:hypothetical protein
MTAPRHQRNQGIDFGRPDLPIVVVKSHIGDSSDYSSLIANNSQ